MDPYCNWTIRVVPYLSISWNYSLWWLIYGGLTIFGGLLYLAICLCSPTILDVYVSIIRDVALNYVVKINICVSDLHF